MSRRTVLITGGLVTSFLFFVAMICGGIWLYITHATVTSFAATGAQPSTGGWTQLLASMIAATGFSVSGIATAIITAVVAWRTGKPANTATVTQSVELASSFAALSQNRSDRAAQRRFVFALADELPLFVQGLTTSTTNGVVTLQYSGYVTPQPADPSSPEAGVTQ